MIIRLNILTFTSTSSNFQKIEYFILNLFFYMNGMLPNKQVYEKILCFDWSRQWVKNN